MLDESALAADWRGGSAPGNVAYRDMAEFIARRAHARCAFVYVLEGRSGSGWAAFGRNDVSPMMLAELLRGFCEDMKPEEAGRRREQGIDDAASTH